MNYQSVDSNRVDAIRKSQSLTCRKTYAEDLFWILGFFRNPCS
jgi:hypothetical protein